MAQAGSRAQAHCSGGWNERHSQPGAQLAVWGIQPGADSYGHSVTRQHHQKGVAEFREVSQKFLLVGVMDRFDSRSAADAAANPSVSDVEFQFLRRVGICFFNEIDQWVKSGDSSVAGVHFVNIWELGGFAEEDLFGRSGNGDHCRNVPTSEQRNQPRATYDPRMKYQNVIREEAQRMIDKKGL
ncbi:hypothetical protein BV898_19236 [Hypsibius exemplaris]|uniref:Uncharacterized protein n=1 Tax=Hypsibius exemplaris TaxID=2072580 RepID=A0A9X6RNW2_HYPEX|nr:hypothetical protein BV898_19236 [Hypsibius exemplaris]